MQQNTNFLTLMSFEALMVFDDPFEFIYLKHLLLPLRYFCDWLAEQRLDFFSFSREIVLNLIDELIHCPFPFDFRIEHFDLILA